MLLIQDIFHNFIEKILCDYLMFIYYFRDCDCLENIIYFLFFFLFFYLSLRHFLIRHFLIKVKRHNYTNI